MSREKVTNRTAAKQALAERLKRALQQRGWNQSDLARHLGAKPAVVQRWIAEVHLPSAATLRTVNIWLLSVETSGGSGETPQYSYGGAGQSRAMESQAEYPERGRGKRHKLVQEIKRFALEADIDLIKKLLENVAAFTELMEHRREKKER